MLKNILVEDFQGCYQKWEQRLHWRLAVQGNYFEGDNIDVWKKNSLVHKKSVSLLFCHTSYIYCLNSKVIYLYIMKLSGFELRLIPYFAKWTQFTIILGENPMGGGCSDRKGKRIDWPYISISTATLFK